MNLGSNNEPGIEASLRTQPAGLKPLAEPLD